MLEKAAALVSATAPSREIPPMMMAAGSMLLIVALALPTALSLTPAIMMI